jgi:hypothetical protein
MKRRGPGRPPKRASEKLGECVMVRMNREERTLLKADARRAGVPLATFLLQTWRSARQTGDARK